MHDKVDVLIIGSGASGAAVAWSLADTRMRILCLEQGDWVNPTDYPSNGRDWEARLFGDFAIRPNRRARRDRLSDQRRQFADQGRELQRRRRQHDHVHGAFSAPAPVGLQGAARSTASPTTGRSTTTTLEPFFAENDRMMGVVGPGGRSRPIRRKSRRCRRCRWASPAQRLAAAMNKLGWHWWPSDIDDRHRRLRGPRALHQPRPLHAGLRAGRQGQYRHHLLAAGDPRRRGAAHALPGARDHGRRARHGVRRRSITTPRARSSSSRPRWSSSPATASARRACC